MGVHLGVRDNGAQPGPQRLHLEPGWTSPDESNGAEDSMQLAANTAPILQAINDTKISLEYQIAAVVNEVWLLRDDQRKLTDTVKESEDQLSSIIPQVADLTEQCKAMDKKLQ
ncbi:hypothetical protein NDU88_002917 [Pleurodeles waltl]|uniref:Uncharacterized protein n=1 Tax=Pleurodeles waltl TaxID=8319 RepID=A0AAV7UYI2_PLEWA|nr:hypothetical protein NDU88_002917 [Pleurodeles waltl]